ncbi:MAG: lipid II:glycine glycyltransferase FemX, partial [Candidatus Rokuibacteriota bacterium]
SRMPSAAPGNVPRVAGRLPSALAVLRITDRDEWNDLVQRLPGCDLRNGYEWGAMRAEQGWQAERLAVVEHGECLAACTVQSRRVGPIGAVLYAPRGPLFVDAAALAALVAEVKARASRAVFLRISPAIPEADATARGDLARLGFVALPETWTPWNAPRHVQVLDIQPPEQELLSGLRRRYRRYVANVGRKGLVVERGDSDAALVAFYGLMVELSRVKRFPIRDLGYFRSLHRRYAEGDRAIMLVARTHGDVVGALLGFRFGSRAYIHYSSVRSGLPDAVKHGVAPALFWDFIRRAKAAGCAAVDFGSSGVTRPPDEDHPNHGVYAFKAGLGARLEAYLPYHDLVFRRGTYAAFRFGETRAVPALFAAMARRPALTRLLRRVV